LFRVEKGKIAEHWDLIADRPQKTEWNNANGKFQPIAAAAKDVKLIYLMDPQRGWSFGCRSTITELYDHVINDSSIGFKVASRRISPSRASLPRL